MIQNDSTNTLGKLLFKNEFKFLKIKLENHRALGKIILKNLNEILNTEMICSQDPE
jgi:predicted component of type VI protein secretion system